MLESLEGVFNLDYPSLEVVVIDDGSTDGSFEAVKRFVEEKKPSDVRVKVLRLDRNYGFAGGVNRSMLLEVPTQSMLPPNNDAVPHLDSLGRMIEVLEAWGTFQLFRESGAAMLSGLTLRRTSSRSSSRLICLSVTPASVSENMAFT